jgi:hypothetical protein
VRPTSRTSEEHARFGSQHQQAGEGFVVVLVGERPEDVCSALAAEDVELRLRGVERERRHRDRDRDQDPFQRAEQHDAEQRDDRPDELGAAHVKDAAERRRLDEADRVRDDDRRQHRRSCTSQSAEQPTKAPAGRLRPWL